jgi:hypothetical protein
VRHVYGKMHIFLSFVVFYAVKYVCLASSRWRCHVCRPHLFLIAFVAIYMVKYGTPAHLCAIYTVKYLVLIAFVAILTVKYVAFYSSDAKYTVKYLVFYSFFLKFMFAL